jgi:alpha-glucosidase (family GH31 glycosyl hydrolase)
MQFSISPWQYNKSMEEACSKLVDLHASTVHPLFEEFALEALKTGAPVIRPVWWADNANTDAYDVSDEFMIGDRLLVAPVVRPKQYKRDVFFPRGKWTDADKKNEYTGPSLIKDYAAPLETIPYFYKVE